MAYTFQLELSPLLTKYPKFMAVSHTIVVIIVATLEFACVLDKGCV